MPEDNVSEDDVTYGLQSGFRHQNLECVNCPFNRSDMAVCLGIGRLANPDIEDAVLRAELLSAIQERMDGCPEGPAFTVHDASDAAVGMFWLAGRL
jgi:hypothetical protein